MKTKILLSLLMICSMIYSSQAQLSSSSSSWKELRVGDTMPDIPLGTVVNNVTGKKRFSDFKGKLVILDFWNSGCTSCIAAWPHMSALQEKYKGRIQIFLVNHQETQEEIEQQLVNIYKNIYKDKVVYPANLPSIVSSKHGGDNIFNAFFPPKGETGYHVWIDGKGVIVLRGNGPINTYEEKIEALLSGKEISYVSDEGVDKYENGGIPLYLALSKVNRPVVEYHSIITRLTEEIAPYSGIRQRNYVDSTNGSIRNSYLNYAIRDLYVAAIETRALREEWSTILNPEVYQFIVKVLATDKSKFSRDYVMEPITDKWYRDNAFSYELITPFSTSDSLIRAYMLEDLNRYFGHLYGTEGRMEKRKVECWQIIRSSSKNKLPVPSITFRVIIKEVNKEGKAFMEYGNIELREILRNIITYNKGLTEHNSLPFIDATQFEGRVDLRVPKKINTIEELRTALQPYGLDVVKGEKEISGLIIQEQGVEE